MKKTKWKIQNFVFTSVIKIFQLQNNSSCVDNLTAYYVLDIVSIYIAGSRLESLVLLSRKIRPVKYICTSEIIFDEVYPTKVTMYVYLLHLVVPLPL